MTNPQRILCVVTFAIFLQCGVNGFIFGSRLSGFGFGAAFNFQLNQDSNVNNSLRSIVSLAQSIAASSENDANQLGQQIQRLSSEVISGFGANITNLIETHANHCAEILNRALGFGGNVSECAEEHYAEFESLLNETLAGLEDCVIDKIDEGMKIVNDSINNHLEAIRLAANVTQGLSNCLRLTNGNPFLIISPGVIACKVRLAAVSSARLVQLKAAKARNAIEAGAYLATLKIDLLACGLTEITRATEQAAIIASEIALCISDDSEG